MKKIISMLMVIALLAASATAFAEGNTQNNQTQGVPQQGQMQGSPMMGGPNQGNRFNGQPPTGQPPFGERPSGAPGMPGGEKPADAPEQPSGEKPAMIDFDAMVAKGVISRETCDKIKAYMAEHKPAGMPGMNGQAPNGEKPEGLPEMNSERPADGQTPPELPDGKKPEGMPGMNGQAPEAPAMGGLLKELLDDEVITQAEYDALVAAQTADAA